MRQTALSLPLGDVAMRAPCAWCGRPIPGEARRDAVTCSKRCRQARHRFQRECPSRPRTDAPLRLAYADPPYPSLARRYYADHPDYAGEVDHAELLSRLASSYDGWALSTSARALPLVLRIALVDVGLDPRHVRVASWHRGGRAGVARWPRAAWEPVIYAGGRREASRDTCEDALVHGVAPRTTDPRRVVGTKPAAFAWWLFQLLGALPGDELSDLYPGSGGIARAWAVYESRALAARAVDGAERHVEQCLRDA